MDNTNLPVQIGPHYGCFACGAPGARLAASFTPCGSALDAWSAYIWYLQLPCSCQNASRVVRVGDCITPLAARGPDGLTAADIPSIQAGLQAILRARPLDMQQLDPAVRIVYDLLIGAVTPHEAIADLQALIRDPAHPPTRRALVRPPEDIVSQTSLLTFNLPEGATP